MNKFLVVILAIILVATSAFRARVSTTRVTEAEANYYSTTYTESEMRTTCTGKTGTLLYKGKVVDCDKVNYMLANMNS